MTFNSKNIYIHDIKISKKDIVAEITCSKNIKKYFLSNELHITYDINLENIPNSILSIPVISPIITTAWMIGANVHIEELDKRYFDSINNLAINMKNVYPRLPLSTIYANNLISNSFGNSNYGLLYSGGIDSITAYIMHKSKRPRLIHCLVWDEPYNGVRVKLKNFAEKEEIPINIVHSNIYFFINAYLLYINSGLNWWSQLAHGLVYSSLCAPLSVKYNLSNILISSAGKMNSSVAELFDPRYEDIYWSNCDVRLVGTGLSRQDKIRYIKNNCGDSNKLYDFLKPIELACNTGSIERDNRTFNSGCGKDQRCNSASKCIRNILGLSLENIDPAALGYSVDENSFNYFKKRFIEGFHRHRHFDNEAIKNDMIYFRDIQEHIEDMVNYKYNNSEEFFDWFKNFNLNSCLEFDSSRDSFNQKFKKALIHDLFKFYFNFFSDKLPKKVNKSIIKKVYRK